MLFPNDIISLDFSCYVHFLSSFINGLPRAARVEAGLRNQPQFEVFVLKDLFSSLISVSRVSARVSQAWHRTAALQEKPPTPSRWLWGVGSPVLRAGHTGTPGGQQPGLWSVCVSSAHLALVLATDPGAEVHAEGSFRVAAQGGGVVLGVFRKRQTLVWMDGAETTGKERAAGCTELCAVMCILDLQ